jgi:hypothetical protein
MNAPQCYVTRTLPVLLVVISTSQGLSCRPAFLYSRPEEIYDVFRSCYHTYKVLHSILILLLRTIRSSRRLSLPEFIDGWHTNVTPAAFTL